MSEEKFDIISLSGSFNGSCSESDNEYVNELCNEPVNEPVKKESVKNEPVKDESVNVPSNTLKLTPLKEDDKVSDEYKIKIRKLVSIWNEINSTNDPVNSFYNFGYKNKLSCFPEKYKHDMATHVMNMYLGYPKLLLNVIDKILNMFQACTSYYNLCQPRSLIADQFDIELLLNVMSSQHIDTTSYLHKISCNIPPVFTDRNYSKDDREHIYDVYIKTMIFIFDRADKTLDDYIKIELNKFIDVNISRIFSCSNDIPFYINRLNTLNERFNGVNKINKSVIGKHIFNRDSNEDSIAVNSIKLFLSMVNNDLILNDDNTPLHILYLSMFDDYIKNHTNQNKHILKTSSIMQILNEFYVSGDNFVYTPRFMDKYKIIADLILSSDLVSLVADNTCTIKNIKENTFVYMYILKVIKTFEHIDFPNRNLQTYTFFSEEIHDHDLRSVSSVNTSSNTSSNTSTPQTHDTSDGTATDTSTNTSVNTSNKNSLVKVDIEIRGFPLFIALVMGGLFTKYFICA